MEARNFVTAREMVQNGNWLIPTMNDLPRLTKPPLPTWLTAAVMMLTGNSDSLALLRLPAAIAATLMVFFMFGLSERFAKDPLSPFLNAVVLASCFYVIFMGRQGTWDIFCHCFMLLAVWCLYAGWHSVARSYMLFLLSGTAMGLSFLSKGPVSFYTVLLPFLIAYFICFDGSAAKFKWKGTILTLITAIIVSGAWPLYIYLNLPEVAAEVAQTESGSWVSRNVRPFWYYWNFPVHAGMWTVMAIVILVWPYAKPRIDQFGNYKFFVYWLMAALFLLSAVPEKKVRYLLPAFIPFSFLVGNYINYLIDVYKKRKETLWDIRILQVNTFIFLIIAVAVLTACYFKFYWQGAMSMGYMLVCLMFYTGLGFALVYFFRNRKILALFLVFVLLNASAYFLLFPLASPLIYANANYQSLTTTRNMPEISNQDLYYLNENDEIRIERIWEIGRPVGQWKYQNRCQCPQEDAFILFSRLSPGELFKDCGTRFDFEIIRTFDYRKERSGELYYLIRLKPTP